MVGWRRWWVVPEGQPIALFVQSASAMSVVGVWKDAKRISGLETMRLCKALKNVKTSQSQKPSDETKLHLLLSCIFFLPTIIFHSRVYQGI